MKHMTLKEITAACGGNYYGNDTDFEKEVTGVAIDSRQIEEGFLFVALKGERSDGHSFIPQVMQSGALCALSEQELGDVPYPYILVKSWQSITGKPWISRSSASPAASARLAPKK